MNQALLDQTTTDKVYGAVSFRDVDTAAGTFDYTVHVSQTAEENKQRLAAAHPIGLFF